MAALSPSYEQARPRLFVQRASLLTLALSAWGRGGLHVVRCYCTAGGVWRVPDGALCLETTRLAFKMHRPLAAGFHKTCETDDANRSSSAFGGIQATQASPPP